MDGSDASLTPRDRAARRRVETRQGAPFSWRLLARRGSTSRVHLGVDPRGARIVAKLLSSARSHGQERRALTDWMPRAGLAAPVLLDEDPALRLIVMSHVAGRPGEEARPDEEVALHAAAGRWLAGLHALAIADDDPVPLAAALRARALALARELAALGRASEAGALTRLADRTDGFAGDLRRACHRDLRPANWIYRQGEGGIDLTVIDFEHARPDHAFGDLVRLETGAWNGRPDLRAAFLDAYRSAGGPHLENDGRRSVLLALDAARAWAWARRRDDDTHAGTALARLHAALG